MLDIKLTLAPEQVLQFIKYQLQKMKTKNNGWSVMFSWCINDVVYADFDEIKDKQTTRIFKELKDYFLTTCKFEGGRVSCFKDLSWNKVNKIVNG